MNKRTARTRAVLVLLRLIWQAVKAPTPPVRWVLLDDTGAVVGVARTNQEVADFIATMVDDGESYDVQVIGDRCHECGEHIADPHAPGCPREYDAEIDA